MFLWQGTNLSTDTFITESAEPLYCIDLYCIAFCQIHPTWIPGDCQVAVTVAFMSQRDHINFLQCRQVTKQSLADNVCLS